MNSYTAQETKDSTFFTKNVYIDKKFLLLTPEIPLEKEIKNLLQRWDFDLIYSEGTKSEFIKVENESGSQSEDALKKTKNHEISSKRLKEEKLI